MKDSDIPSGPARSHESGNIHTHEGPADERNRDSKAASGKGSTKQRADPGDPDRLNKKVLGAFSDDMDVADKAGVQGDVANKEKHL
jgi:hypothetical protein